MSYRIAVVVGSLRRESFNRRLAGALALLAPKDLEFVQVRLDDLPPYDGPAEPVAGYAPEWGAAAADAPDEGPLEGPALAPYPQAADPDSD